jgi:PmbA protein
MSATSDSIGLLSDLIAKARRLGADEADALAVESTSLSAAIRLGQTERFERAEGGDVGLRVLIGKRQAMVSSSDRSAAALDDLVARALSMAKTVPEDSFCGLAPPDQLAGDVGDLDIHDAEEPSPDILVTHALAAETAARAVSGVTNSEGAEIGWGQSTVTLAASNGFARSYRTSGASLSASVIAGSGASGMERDYDYSSAVHFSDLRPPEEIGKEAGERAVKRLGARKVPTIQVPVIYEPRVARSLLGHLTGAINGASIARGTSFLKDALGKRVLSRGLNIIDDPHKPRGLRSKPWDGEGVANQKRYLVEDGVLNTWLLDLRAARQLGMVSTGHASRGTNGPPSPAPTNVWLEPGVVTPAELIADIPNGFYVTELIGMGVNGVTGDYSRGAAGFWIENGEISYPVSEVTVAGNLRDMFRNMTAANDLEFKTGMDAPTLLIEGLTVAGA